MNEKTCYCILECMRAADTCINGIEKTVKVLKIVAKKHNRLVIFTLGATAVTHLVIGEMNRKIDILTKEIEELKRMEGE